ncbi:unnamed protein product [Phytomonas sp. EM1]|nr:unnamed protein product [Phytomonas sp. EM1]|eukprot:CCW63227.1 unnamed protein product [Phytomonas sp. isolate EM1]
MSSTCSGLTNDELVSALVRKKLLKSPTVIAAMRRIDRRWFIPSAFSAVDAYRDSPLYIGHGATISAPHMHAIALEVMAPYIIGEHRLSSSTDSDIRILDIGSGSGYLTAVMADICSTHNAANDRPWKVIGLEHVKELQNSSLSAIKKHFPSWIERGNVEMICGDGRNLEKALSSEVVAGRPLTFDVIHVGAAIPTTPSVLLNFLKLNSCLVVPVGAQHETQRLMVFCKDQQGKVTQETNCLVSFIPLTSIDDQLGSLR